MADWKDIVGAVAPGLATALGGPLAGGVVAVLADKILGTSTGDPIADEAKIAGVLAGGVTPELRAKIIDAETSLKLEMLKTGIRTKEIDADTDKAYLGDVADARKAHAANRDVFTLGGIVLMAWGLLTAATLFGLYQLLVGGIEIKDPGVIATVFTVLGAQVGYVSNAAQQVLSYVFGSSRGSAQKTAAMTDAISNASKR